MSEKAIVFIDGGWLYKYRTALFTKLGENNFEIDYAKLPRMLCEDVADAIDEDVSLVKTLYFGTIPSSRSGYNTSKQYSFYDFLDRTCGYDTNIHEIDVIPEDVRSAGSSWVDVSMATNIVYYSSLPCVMDIAIIVSDSIDLLPAIRRARSLGKRVQLVGDRHPPSDSTEPRIGDFHPICLEDHAADIRLVRELVKRICKQCGREEETTWAGAEFFCDRCRGRHRNS